MAAKLYVGGLSYSTTSESLREYFSQCGTVESATVVTDRFSGQSRGFGFVEMATEAEAQAAISKLNDQPFEGRRLTVNIANPQAARSGGGRPGGGRPGGGFGGGRGGGGFGGGSAGGPRRTPRW
jgi:RNA recognition motif-containing protein